MSGRLKDFEVENVHLKNKLVFNLHILSLLPQWVKESSYLAAESCLSEAFVNNAKGKILASGLTQIAAVKSRMGKQNARSQTAEDISLTFLQFNITKRKLFLVNVNPLFLFRLRDRWMYQRLLRRRCGIT